MNKFLYKVFDLYYDGFRNMRVGRTLWLASTASLSAFFPPTHDIKLFIIFVILKLFFFPDFIGEHSTPGGEAEYVSGQLTGR